MNRKTLQGFMLRNEQVQRETDKHTETGKGIHLHYTETYRGL